MGIAGLAQPDGSFRAQEVLVFPESARGTGEGHYPWDLTPGSTMTNATVDVMVERVEGPMLTLKHKGGSVQMAVPPDVPIVTFAPGDRTLLQPGRARLHLRAAAGRRHRDRRPRAGGQGRARPADVSGGAL